MNNKTLLHIVIYALCVLLLCTGINGTFFRRRGKNVKEVQTALLNPKYATEVNTIRLYTDMYSLSLAKAESFWFARLNTVGTEADMQGTEDAEEAIFFPVDGQRIQDLITASLKIRNMYTISDKNVPFFTRNGTVFTLEFSHETENGSRRCFSSLYVKKNENDAKNLHILSAQKAASVYAVEDDFSVFLNFNPAFWADGKLIPDCIRRGNTEEDVQRLLYSGFDLQGTAVLQKTLVSGDKLFQSAVHTLFHSRTANIVPLPETVLHKANTRLSEIKAVFSDGSFVFFTVYDDRRGAYLVIPDLGTQSVEHYALAISQWTYRSLIEPFHH